MQHIIGTQPAPLQGVRRRYDPKVSVSIVLFNTPEKDVRNALADLKAITLPVIVTVIDNSRTDELRAIAEATGTPYRHSGSNSGFGSGHNHVLRAKISDAPYHLVMNADVRIPPKTLETLVAYMDANPGVGLVMPKVLNADGSEQLQARRLPTPLDLVGRRIFGTAVQHWELSLRKDVPISMPFLSGCFMLIRGSTLAECGLFDERFFLYMEDTDLSRRIGAIADTVYYPAVNIYHHRARASYSSLGMLLVHLRSAIRYFNKWGWIYDEERRQRNERAGTPVENRSRPSVVAISSGLITSP